jgi:hypothetical protein
MCGAYVDVDTARNEEPKQVTTRFRFSSTRVRLRPNPGREMRGLMLEGDRIYQYIVLCGGSLLPALVEEEQMASSGPSTGR